MIAHVWSNDKFIWRLTQAEVANGSGRKLPKVPPKDCEGVHYIKRNLAKAFERLR